MKTILGVIASARRLGNCEIMVKEVFRHIDQPCQLNLLRLTEFQIDPCRGCYTCLFKQGACVIDDDHATVLAAITSADAIILAAPAYFLAAHSALKRFLDRGLTLYNDVDRLWGKPAVGVAVAGIPGMEGGTLLDVARFLKLLLADVRDTRVVYGALPGEVLLNDANRAAARAMADRLWGDQAPPAEPHCPLCGGDTFRFIGPNRVRCMLCSNAGSMAIQGDTVVLDLQKGAHQLFLSRQDALDHRDWLIGMKQRFKDLHGSLKPVTAGYRRDGQWIRPASSSTARPTEREDGA